MVIRMGRAAIEATAEAEYLHKSKHIQNASTKSSLKYEIYHRLLGLCTRCSNSVEANSTLCSNCRDTRNAYQKARRARLASENKCTICAIDLLIEKDEGYSRCISCRGKDTMNCFNRYNRGEMG